MTTGKISSVSRVGVVSHSHPLTLYNSLILSQRNRITHLNISLINNSRVSVAFIVHGSITFGIFLLLRMVFKRILEVGLEEHSKSWVIGYGPQDLCINIELSLKHNVEVEDKQLTTIPLFVLQILTVLAKSISF